MNKSKNEIRIKGLTDRQIGFLEIIWQFETEDDFLAWSKTLSDKDQLEALDVLILLKTHIILMDDMVEDDNPMVDAKEVLEKIMGGLV